MKFKRLKSSTRKVKGPRRHRQHSPPAIEKSKLHAKTDDGTKIVKPHHKKAKRKKEDPGGNTPRAFVQLMSRLERTKKPSHDGSMTSRGDSQDHLAEKTKKKDGKVSKAAAKAAAAEEKAKAERKLKEGLVMQPGETFSEFSRRVDEALPVVKAKSSVPSAGAIRKLKKREIAEANGQKPILSKKERKAAAEQGGEDDDGEDYSDEEAEERRYAELKSKRSNSPDPWKRLSRPPPPKFGEVAQAPPVLKPPTKKLANVPKKAGTAAERMVLEAERATVIARYRAMAARKQLKAGMENASLATV